MNHCDDCRDGNGECDRAKHGQAYADARTFTVCPAPGCGQSADSHEPYGPFCEGRP